MSDKCPICPKKEKQKKYIMSETQNIAYKSSWQDDYLKWIGGFANAQGGRIYIGKDDAGKTIGVDDYKTLMTEIPNKIKNNLGKYRLSEGKIKLV